MTPTLTLVRPGIDRCGTSLSVIVIVRWQGSHNASVPPSVGCTSELATDNKYRSLSNLVSTANNSTHPKLQKNSPHPAQSLRPRSPQAGHVHETRRTSIKACPATIFSGIRAEGRSRPRCRKPAQPSEPRGAWSSVVSLYQDAGGCGCSPSPPRPHATTPASGWPRECP